MERDWPRLQKALREARRALRVDQADLARMADLDRNTIVNLEGGRTYSRLPLSLGALEAVFGWPRGTCKSILEGGPIPPVRRTQMRSPASSAFAEGMPWRVQSELKTGQVVETMVVELPDANLVGILKVNDPESLERLDPERVEKLMTLWADFQRAAQELTYPPDEPGDEEFGADSE